jgi:hypothetical protein
VAAPRNGLPGVDPFAAIDGRLFFHGKIGVVPFFRRVFGRRVAAFGSIRFRHDILCQRPGRRRFRRARSPRRKPQTMCRGTPCKEFEQSISMESIEVCMQALLLSMLLGLLSPEPAERLVGAYYYPWYTKDRWTREPVCNTPQLGWYSSDDRSVAAQHLKWAKEADLGFFLVSWLTSVGHEGKNLDNALLPELTKAGFRFALLYETPLALGLPAGKPIDLESVDREGVKAGDRFVKQFDHLTRTYLKHPNYLRHQGKAVVVIYLVRDMLNADQYLTAVREQATKLGVELHLIADVVYWAPPERLDWPLLKKHFQTVTAYNMYFRPKFNEEVRAQFEATDRLARSHGLRLIPSVMPGYDDTPLRGEGRATLHRRRGDFYRESWKVAKLFVGDDQPFLLVTSFNEWHEGTELEPSKEHGDLYLRLTRELATELRRRR